MRGIPVQTKPASRGFYKTTQINFRSLSVRIVDLLQLLGFFFFPPFKSEAANILNSLTGGWKKIFSTCEGTVFTCLYSAKSRLLLSNQRQRDHVPLLRVRAKGVPRSKMVLFFPLFLQQPIIIIIMAKQVNEQPHSGSQKAWERDQ